MEKKTVLENLDLVLLVIDEVVDGGCEHKSSFGFCRLSTCLCLRLILETDPTAVAARAAMRGVDQDVPLAEQVCTS